MIFSLIEARNWDLFLSLSKMVSWIYWYRAKEDVASSPISNRQVMGKQKESRIPRKGLRLTLTLQTKLYKEATQA